MGRIMVVDDNDLVAKLAMVVLQNEGHQVNVFLDPNQALLAYAKEPHGYDLILSDVKMPGINGAQLARAMWQINPSQVILFMSGNSDGIELPVNSICLSKPLTGLSVLTQQVDKLLARQQ